MAILERHLQVLFDPAQYAALEAEATAHRQSVAAITREAVDTRLRLRRPSQREALERLPESGNTHPTRGPIGWERGRLPLPHRIR